MRKILIILTACLFLFPALCFSRPDPESSAPEVAKSSEKAPDLYCPKTLISDNNKCFTCHTIPDFGLTEAKPDRAMDFPTFNMHYYEGSLYYIVDNIAGADVQKFFNYLSWHPKYKKVVMEIQSPGGSLMEAWKILGLMDEYKARGITIETRCYGFAASAGFLVFVNGSKGHRFVNPTAAFMWHELWSLSFLKIDTPSKSEEEAKTLRHLQDTIHQWLATRGNLKKEELDKLVHHKEYWINGAEMIENGFADGIIK